MLRKLIFWLSRFAVISMICHDNKSIRNDTPSQTHQISTINESRRRLACKWISWKHETICGDAGSKPNAKVAVPKPAEMKDIFKDKKVASRPPSRGCANNSAVFKEGNVLAKKVGERIFKESRMDPTIIRIQPNVRNRVLLGIMLTVDNKEILKNEHGMSAGNDSTATSTRPFLRKQNNITRIADQDAMDSKGGRGTSKECNGQIAFVMGGQMR